MSSMPEVFLQIAGFGMLANILCTILLRWNVASDSDISREMFARPLLGSSGVMPFLNAKYFVPWRKVEFLEEEGTWIRFLFWAARTGGMVLALGMFGFLGSAIYIGTIGQS